MEREAWKDVTNLSRSRRRLAAGLVTAIWIAAGVALGDDPPAPVGISFLGRVIEKDAERPIAGVTIVVTRSTLGGPATPAPNWVGSTTLTTDADGRFSIEFPPEQVTDPRAAFEISRVAHPDFVIRKGYPTPLSNLVIDQKLGGKPYFETITLERGLEFFGQVVTPDGQATADVPFEFENWARSNVSSHFTNDTTGKTDAEGQFRLRMPRTHSLAISLVPDRYAPFRKFWGTDRPAANPTVFAPTDLERITLETGPIISGKLLDLSEKPIAGQRVIAMGRQNQIRREATTAADGSFAFAPLRPGNYDVFADGEFHGPYIDPTARSMPASAPVIRPAKVYFPRQDESPPPIELREIPSVRVEVRFVDSKGQPTQGSLLSLSGTIPGEHQSGDGLPGLTPASSINQVEPEDKGKRLGWGCQLAPDGDGRVVFRAPRGLVDAVLETFPPEGLSYKTRLVAGGPLKFWGGGRIGTVDADRSGIEVVVYQAPSVVATIKTEDGEPIPLDAKVHAGFESRGFSYGVNVTEQPDGRFRTKSLMPYHEAEFYAWAKGYVPKNTELVNLPEGVSTELTLILRKKPTPPAIGNLAPPFAVATLDGRIASLADFRGKHVLLHAWTPFHQQDKDLARIEAIRKRYGEDRIALLGLCLTADAEEAMRSLKFWKVTWPRAILRDSSHNPIIQDYGCDRRAPWSILIGPDGTVVARDLDGDKLEPMLEGVLGPK